ncbi:MAG: four helix bundle protein [Candidatus Niyogibacteria bacterium]|nr:four helix bundle protein [Candidatus Niyogibacteria bacterium]
MQKPNTKTTDQNQKTEFQKRVYIYTLNSLKFLSAVRTDKDAAARVILGQLIRSLSSIGANIIEAKASNSKKDFARYFDIALKSANETKYWLYLVRDLKLADGVKIAKVIDETREISNILAASLITMRKKREI